MLVVIVVVMFAVCQCHAVYCLSVSRFFVWLLFIVIIVCCLLFIVVVVTAAAAVVVVSVIIVTHSLVQ